MTPQPDLNVEYIRTANEPPHAGCEAAKWASSSRSRKPKNERSAAIRVLDLVESVMRDPFEGLGKPEPLKYVLAGCWSRRITQEHRLVYRVTDETVDFLQARFHY